MGVNSYHGSDQRSHRSRDGRSEYRCVWFLCSAQIRLAAKTKKHNKIRTLADTKLNTIDEYVSEAIEDGDISHKEFVLINSELKKFNESKEKIRAKVSTKPEKAKTMNKAEFDRQVEERAKAITSELKKDLMEKL